MNNVIILEKIFSMLIAFFFRASVILKIQF